MEDLQVIIERLDHLKEQINEFKRINAEEHVQINTKQDKTNGSVASLNRSRWFFAGGIAVLGSIVVPMALLFFSSFLDKK
jgi:hypothetical protein